jgi:hypothetical protein
MKENCEKYKTHFLLLSQDRLTTGYIQAYVHICECVVFFLVYVRECVRAHTYTRRIRLERL